MQSRIRATPVHSMPSCTIWPSGQYEAAIQAFNRVDIRLWTCLYLASAHAHLGLMDQARAFVSQLLGFRADFRLGQVDLVEPFKDPADLALLVEGLRMGGLSE